VTIDVNVYLSRWPFRRLPDDETPRLVRRLRSGKVTGAWAGSFDGLLHKDVAAVNARLVKECRRHGEGLLIPFGTINPTLPDWQEDLRRCHERHHMPGIRLHPNYHGYRLDDPVCAELLGQAEKRNLIVQLVVKMEDERTQHPLLKVPAVETTPIVKLLPRFPRLRIVLLNSLRTLRSAGLKRLATAGRVWFDIAMQEGVGGVGKLAKTVPVDRVLFGSYAPFFYFESARLKITEAALTEKQTAAILRGNAGKLIDRADHEKPGG